MGLVDELLREETLRELKRSDITDPRSEYPSIETLDQFNEGLEYLVDLIGSIHRMIDEMLDENLQFSCLLNESDIRLEKKWNDAVHMIDLQKGKIYSICNKLQEFLSNGIVKINGMDYTVTKENCIDSKETVDRYTKYVEMYTKDYFEITKKNDRIQYPLDDTIRFYNLSVDHFNGILGGCRSAFDLTLEELPDARRAVI